MNNPLTSQAHAANSDSRFDVPHMAVISCNAEKSSADDPIYQDDGGDLLIRIASRIKDVVHAQSDLDNDLLILIELHDALSRSQPRPKA